MFRNEVFADNLISYEGRVWLDKKSPSIASNNGVSSHYKVKFLSYNVFANCKCSQIDYSNTKSWEYRSICLINEIKAYDADIVALQDVDEISEFWMPQLQAIDYDVLFQHRSNTLDVHYEGVVIALKRNRFKVVSSIPILFNKAGENYFEKGLAFQDKCIQDDVGLMAFLKPIIDSEINVSSILVGSIMLCEIDGFEDVRELQSIYLTKQIELINREFQAPIILGMSLLDNPSSRAYHILRTGRFAIQANTPVKMIPPKISFESRGSLKLLFKEPPMSPADPPILSFNISYRPGGSKVLGFHQIKTVLYADCIQYIEIINENGQRDTVRDKNLMCFVNGLTSEVPYEFQIVAINKFGEGTWSDPTPPIILKNPSKRSTMPQLETMMNLSTLRLNYESSIMLSNDINASQYSSTAIGSTNLTPRNLEGRELKELPKSSLIPTSVNCRIGWEGYTARIIEQNKHDNTLKLKTHYKEELKELLQKKSNIKRSVIRDENGHFLPTVSDSALGNISSTRIPSIFLNGTNTSNDQMSSPESSNSSIKHVDFKNQIADISTFQSSVISVDEGISPVKSDNDDDEDDWVYPVSYNLDTNGDNECINYDSQNIETNNETNLKHERFYPYQKFSLCLADDYNNTAMIDCQDVVPSIGSRNDRTVHDLSFRSAYEAYGSGGEPHFTTSKPAGYSKSKEFLKEPSSMQNFSLECHDYIFYSSNCNLYKILSIPTVPELRFNGNTPAEPKFTSNLLCLKPSPKFRHLFNQHDELGKELSLFSLKKFHLLNSDNLKRDRSVPTTKLEAKRNSIQMKSLQGALKARFNVFRPANEHNFYAEGFKDGFPQDLVLVMKDELRKRIGCTYKMDLTLSKNDIDEAASDNVYWGGRWGDSNPTRNVFKESLFLPNEKFCSSHIALCAEFYISYR